MITVSKTRNGKFVARGTGKLTSAPQFRTFDSGNTLTSFFVNSDATGKGKDKQYESYKINAWGEWSDYANMLEKGDIILVEGECVRDDYYSKKNNSEEFMINVQEMFIVSIGIDVMRLRVQVDNLKKQLELLNGSRMNNSTPKQNEQEVSPDELFDGIDMSDMPFEDGDYESGI